MSYPRNAASPEPIAIGAVVQIADGAVQTSGVTVRIKPIGVAEGNGAGTTDYSTDGIVLYTPTQAETNYTSFILIAKKTGSIPVSVTVVTSASATPGYAGIDWGKVTNPTTTVGLTGTTVAGVLGNVGGGVLGGVGWVAGDVYGNVRQEVLGGVSSVRGDVMGNVQGYVSRLSAGAIGLTSFQPGSITEAAFSETPATAAQIWSYANRSLTQTAAEIATILAGTDVTLYRGDTNTLTITGLGNITGRTKLWFSVKRSRQDTDAQATIQITETGGLLYLEGAATTSGWGTLVVDDQTAGNITITLLPAATSLLVDRRNQWYDVQVKTAAAAIETLTSGRCDVEPDVTRAVA